MSGFSHVNYLHLALASLFFAGACPAQETSPSTPVLPAPAAPPPLTYPTGVELLQDVVIGQGGGAQLHAYVYRPKIPTPQPMPAVLHFHGGGWSRGTYKSAVGASLAAQGYLVAEIEYRLAPQSRWPAQIEDCKLAVRWLRANAAKYHVDPNRIAAMGSSAGGHLAACLGTMGDEKRFEGTGGYPGVSSKVQAVVEMSGPIDFIDPGQPYQLPKARDGLTLAAPNLFVDGLKDQAVLKQASPLYYVRVGDPPFLIIHGDHDRVVPYTQSVKFVDALSKAGVPVQFITVQGGGHSLSAEKGAPPAVPNGAQREAAVYDFLQQHLAPTSTPPVFPPRPMRAALFGSRVNSAMAADFVFRAVDWHQTIKANS